MRCTSAAAWTARRSWRADAWKYRQGCTDKKALAGGDAIMETTQEAVLVTGGRRASAWRWFGAAGCRTPGAGGRPFAGAAGRHGRHRAAERLGRVRLDVSDEAQVVDALARQESAFGPIGGLVNSAGIGQDLPFLDTETAALRRMLEGEPGGVLRRGARGRAPHAQARTWLHRQHHLGVGHTRQCRTRGLRRVKGGW